MKLAIVVFAALFTFIGSMLSSSTALAASPHTGAFGFNASASGFPHGVVTLTGGGTYDLASRFVRASGGFSCTDTVGQGPLTGC